ncbi:MAG: prephenate dehydrogenase/arogenate dehydrogenase family protein [Blastocatellia bacterium]|nr:prephenate dehydrogenase/arogenate dehydrogenase family protein [Blastocatellia bacterium]
MNGIQELRSVCIVGCGLIGGSFALALRRAGYNGRITAYGGNRSVRMAVERGIVDAIEENIERGGMLEADLIYLAAPIGGIINFLKTRADQIKEGALVTDAGSTKAEICRVARESLPEGIDFIGGHPMAGGEMVGVEYARADLFDRATYALAIEQGTGRLNRLAPIVEALGARVLLTDAESHDAAVALISHLPQLVASALAASLANVDEAVERELAQQLAAGGWRDMTRLAASSWSMWRDICLTNQPNIAASLGRLIGELQSLKDALDCRDFNQVRDLFTAANRSAAEQRGIHYSRFDKV